MNDNTQNENQDILQIAIDGINNIIKHKGSKRGIVKSVNESAFTCNIDPLDKSPSIENARLAHSTKAGRIDIPKTGSLVTVVPSHIYSEEEGEFDVILISEIEKTIQQTENTKLEFGKVDDKELFKYTNENTTIEAKNNGILLKIENTELEIQNDKIIINSANIELGSGTLESLIKGDTLKEIITNWATQIAAHTHPSVGDPPAGLALPNLNPALSTEVKTV